MQLKRATEKLSKYFLDHSAQVDLPDAEGNTALIHAAHDGRTEIVELLIQRRANVNIHGKHGYTALIAGCHHKEVIQLLLKAGALVDAQDSLFRSTALMWAADSYDNHEESRTIA